MDNALCSAVYKEFRDNLIENVRTQDEMIQRIAATITPVTDALHIGLINGKLMIPPSPITKNGVCGNKTIYSDNANGYEPSTLIETFRTGENGIVTLSFNPKKGHKFSEEEIQAIKLLAQDIFILSGRSRLMELIQQASMTDSMTGLPNMPNLIQHGIELKIAQKLQNYTGFFINLKNYKYINTELTAPVGDQGIIKYSKEIANYLEPGEIFARLGGDNFFALIQNIRRNDFIKRFYSLPVCVTVERQTVNFTIVSRMGVYPIREADTMSEVMHCSSVAMNLAKTRFGRDISYFEPQMMDEVLHEKKISSIFQSAFCNKEFVVYYQPKVHLNGNKLYGCEALVRWNHENKIIQPSEFLPVLEKESSICQLDFYVFETVCKDIHEWIQNGITPVRVSSNFSKKNLRNTHLAEDIIATMEKYSIDSKYIEIELTEVSDFDNAKAMRSFINKLRAKGISVSIDDFGTGYSTLNVLKNFNVDVIKLDKSLLDNIGEAKHEDEIVLKNMVSMMNELHKEVIAEGVENDRQIEFLKSIKCSLVQGFIYDQPLCKKDFEKRLIDGYVH